MTAALEVRALTVELGGARLVDAVDVSVDAGHWVSVVGPNGAGKTTLLNAIAGIAPVRSGTVELFGADAERSGARARAKAVALVPQTPVIPGGLFVLDYALLGRTPHLPFLGSESDTTSSSPSRCSAASACATWQRDRSRRCRAASVNACSSRALLQEAPVLLLDEPTAALDIGHQQEVLELVEHLRVERNLAVLSTMHDLTLAGLYADELLLLDGGRVVERGSAASVLTEEHLRRHFGARVTVLDGADGPVVVPYRLAKEARP